MTDYFIVNFIGLLLIAFTVYWFWFKPTPKPIAITDRTIEIIVVDGLYTPSEIKVKKGEPVTLRFLRKEENPCAGTVIFDDFQQSAELSIDEPFDLEITPKKAGEYEFTCQMGMYRGKLIVE